jgi:MFS family permease
MVASEPAGAIARDAARGATRLTAPVEPAPSLVSPPLAPPLLPALGAMMAVQVVIAAAIFVPGTVAPRIGLSPAALSLFAALVFGTAMITAVRGGALVARFGAMRVAAIVCLAAAASLAIAAEGSIVALACAGVLLGIAFGPETPASAALLGRLARPADRPLVFSVRQTGNQIGAALGSFLLPPLVAAVDPRFGYVAVAVPALAVAALCLVLSKRYDGLMVDRTPRPARTSVTAPATGFLAGLRLVLAHRPLAALALASAAFGAMQLTLNTFFVSHAVGLGHSHIEAGIALGVAQLAGLAGRLGWAMGVGRIGSARMIVAGLGLGMGLAAIGLAVAGPFITYPALIALAAVFGATASGWNGIFVAEVTRLAPDARIAETTGAVLSISYAGLLAGPGIVAMTAAIGGLAASFATLGVIALAGAILLILERTDR